MKNQIKEELAGHVLAMISDGVIDNTNKENWHFILFNEDCYLIGYYECEKWLERHEMSAFEAIDICQEYEKEHFGEIVKKYDNAEKVVNMLAYIYGEELLSEFKGESIEELEEFMTDIF
jgi:hypothetical protein